MYTIMFLCAIISTLFFLIWLILFILYRKQYSGLLDDVDGKIFTLKDLYFIGLGTIDSYEKIRQKKITTSEKALGKIKKLSEVFGRNNAELYYYVTVAAKVSLILTFIPIGLMLTCLIESTLGLVCGILLAFILPYGVQSSINAAVAEKRML